MVLQAVLNLQVPWEHAKEVSDCKHLIKTLVMGNGTLLFISVSVLLVIQFVLLMWPLQR